MRKTAALVFAAVLAFLGLLVMPTAGAAATPHITAHLSKSTVISGEPFTVTAHANTLCDWIVTFHGERRHSIGRSFRTVFTAPEVTVRSRLNVVVTCVVRTRPTEAEPVPPAPDSGSPRDVQTLVVRIPANATVDPPLTVLPGPVVKPPHTGNHPPGLPNTGGPHLWLLLAGMVAVVIGAVLVQRSLCRGPVAFAVELSGRVT